MRRLAILPALAILAVMSLAACSGGQAEPRELAKADEAYASGLYLEAEELYEQFLQNNPASSRRWEVWNRLVDIVQTIKGEDDKALALLEAMELEFGSSPDKAFAVLTRMGDIYSRERRWKKAVESWHRAQRINGLAPEKQCQIMMRLGRAYRSTGQYDLAIEWFAECAGLPPGAPCTGSCKYELAQSYYFVGNTAQAERLLVDILETHDNPANPDTPGGVASDGVDPSVAAFLLADVYLSEGRTEEARGLLLSIKESYPNPMAVEVKLKHLK